MFVCFFCVQFFFFFFGGQKKSHLAIHIKCNLLCFSRSIFDNIELLEYGLPGALVTALPLAVHEISHALVAKEIGIKLGMPYFVPSWQVRNIVILI